MESSELDTSYAPVGELAQRRLIEGILRLGDFAERHYLEAKSDVDLTTKLGVAKLAKFILGASNRLPDVAERHFQGYAVMVLGVTKGQITGIPRIESMEIESGLRPYLSAQGPLWDVNWHTFDEHQVAVFLVDPPKRGSGAFYCWKEFQQNGKDGDSRKNGLRNGAVYIRRDGETREATADDQVALAERGGAAVPEVELDVKVSEAAHRCIDDRGALTRYVQAKVRELAGQMPPADPPSRDRKLGLPSSTHNVAAVLAAANIVNAMSEPEDRTPAEFERQVNTWADAAVAEIPHLLRKATGALGQPVTIQVQNLTSSFLEDVELIIEFEDDVAAVSHPTPNRALADAKIFDPPRPWGPRSKSFGFNTSAILPSYFPVSAHQGSRPWVRWTNDHPAILTIEFGELRPGPGRPIKIEGPVLVVSSPALTMVRGTWSMTARGYHARFRGDLTIPVISAPDVGGADIMGVPLNGGE